MIVFMKELLEKDGFEKKSADDKKTRKISQEQRVKTCSMPTKDNQHRSSLYHGNCHSWSTAELR